MPAPPRPPPRPRQPSTRMTRCATSTRARPPPTSPRCARIWRARRSCPSRTRCPRRCTAPATRSPAARRWPQARHGIRLAEPLDHWLRHAFDSGLGLTTRGSLAARRLHDGHGVGRERISMSRPATSSITGSCSSASSAADRGLEQRIAAAAAAEKAADAPPAAAGQRGALAPAEQAVADFDPEVAAIFTDEATELIEASEQRAVQRLAQRAAAAPTCAETQAPAAHPQGRRAHGRHHGHGRPEPRARVARDARSRPAR